MKKLWIKIKYALGIRLTLAEQNKAYEDAVNDLIEMERFHRDQVAVSVFGKRWSLIHPDADYGKSVVEDIIKKDN
jgi:hypothetical protein